MVPHFDKIFRRFKDSILFINDSARPSLELHPLVCDIESDIPGVIENFCNNSTEFFYQQVENSKLETGHFFENQYPDIEVVPNTFTSLIGKEFLNSKMSLIDNYIQQDESKLPREFFLQAKHVATIRANSILRQYGKETMEEQYKMALRHMKSYLAVSMALAEKFPDGCLVFNNNSPNLYYVKSTSKLKKLFDLADCNFPIFIAT